jgi:hypothetical protein
LKNNFGDFFGHFSFLDIFGSFGSKYLSQNKYNVFPYNLLGKKISENYVFYNFGSS